MSDSQGDPLLTLYSEKMKYLGECHKVYYWMLALFATGLVVSIGFLVKSKPSDKVISYLIVGAPFLINAWCAGYLFCYWHNNLLCRNIDYLENLIGNKIDNNGKSFPTWYNGIFVIFTKTKFFKYALFFMLSLPILSLAGFCIYLTLSKVVCSKQLTFL